MKRETSLRRAAEMYEVNRMSLLRYVRKRDGAGASNNEDNISMGYVAHNKVFSKDQEQELSRTITRWRKFIKACLRKRFGPVRNGLDHS